MDQSFKPKSFSTDLEGYKNRRSFSKSPARINNVSAAKTKKIENVKKKKKRWSIHKSETEGNSSNNNKDKPDYISSSPGVSPDYSKLTYTTSVDHPNGINRSNDKESRNNFHYFIHQSFTAKCKRCEFCKKEFNSKDKLVICKYCRGIYHEECCNKVKEKCNNNQLLMLNDILQLNQLNINSDVNTKISESQRVSNDSKEIIIPSISQFSTSNYNNNVESHSYYFYQDNSLNNASSLSMPLSAHNSYDFTTLDRDRINKYGIAVHPISEENKSYDYFNFHNSKKKETMDHNNFCKSSYLYNEMNKKIVKIDWNIKSLKMKSIWFNKNNFGLNCELKTSKSDTYVLGSVRIYINLLRPIKMELSSKPKSIYDVIDSKKELKSFDFKIETIWLPRGSSKLLYVKQSTSTIEVINCLLKKFYIKVDPKIFGLYEHTIEGDRQVSVRKIADIECPLALLLSWSSEDVDKFNKIMRIKRLVLQENETGDIEWSEFSIPELRNFLLILRREEEEISKQIKLKYSVLKNEVIRLRDLLLKTATFITVL